MNKNQKSKIKNQKGFTLVEMLVVIFIVAILSAATLAAIRQGNKRSSVLRAAQRVAQDLRDAQNRALAAVEFQGKVPCGWGIEFVRNQNYYLLFADRDPNSEDDCGNNKLHDSGPLEDVKEIKFEENVMVSSVSPTSPLPIVFIPPDPITYINAVTGPGTADAQITVQRIDDPSITRVVRVRVSGQIQIE